MTEETERRCKSCDEVKEIAQFAYTGGGHTLPDGTVRRYRMHTCKKCFAPEKARNNKNWRDRNTGRIKKQNKTLKKPNAEKIKARKERKYQARAKVQEVKKDVTSDVSQVVQDIRALMGSNTQVQEQMNHFLNQARDTNDTVRAIGRAGLKMLLNDLRSERARRKFQIA